MSVFQLLEIIWNLFKDIVPFLGKICRIVSTHQIKACLWKCFRKKQEFTLVYAALYPLDDTPGNKKFSHHQRKSPSLSSSGIFRVSPAVSEAEVRSISYLTSMLTTCGCEIKIKSDEQMDTDMSSNLISIGLASFKTTTLYTSLTPVVLISIGLASFKTTDNLAENPFIDKYNHDMLSIKTYDNPFVRNKDITFGFIVRNTIEGESTNENVSRISCAGFNAWGTSSAAYFFSKKHHIIYRFIKENLAWHERLLCKFFTGLPDFLAVIKTIDCMDEKSELLELWLIDKKTKNPIRIYPTGGISTHQKISILGSKKDAVSCLGSCLTTSTSEKFMSYDEAVSWQYLDEVTGTGKEASCEEKQK